jgi:hypothetical protein
VSFVQQFCCWAVVVATWYVDLCVSRVSAFIARFLGLRQQQALPVGVDLGAVVADMHQDDAIAKMRAFANALAVDDHESPRWLLGVDMHGDLESGQAVSLARCKVGQRKQCRFVRGRRWIGCRSIGCCGRL